MPVVPWNLANSLESTNHICHQWTSFTSLVTGFIVSSSLSPGNYYIQSHKLYTTHTQTINYWVLFTLLISLISPIIFFLLFFRSLQALLVNVPSRRWRISSLPLLRTQFQSVPSEERDVPNMSLEFGDVIPGSFLVKTQTKKLYQNKKPPKLITFLFFLI